VGTRIRIPLRVLLPCLAVSLVALGAVVVGIADVSAARGYLVRQTDQNLLACASSVLSHPFVAPPTSGPVSGQVPPGTCDMELLSASGQLLTPPAPGTGPGPAIVADGSWLAAHVARPVTVPGTGTSGRWRVVLEAVHFQPQRIEYVYGPDDVQYLIGGRTGRGPGGLLVVMAGLAGVGRTSERVAAGYAAAAGVVLVLLAAAGLALARLIMRPLRDAGELADLAGPAADGELPRVMSPRAMRAGAGRSRWPFATALMRVSEQIRASRTAEAAARRSAEQMSGRLSEVSLALRTSVNVVRGFTEYYQHRGRRQSAGLDPMMRRVAAEVTRMETLIADLDARSPTGSDGPDPPP
jgi:hypothetical protein